MTDATTITAAEYQQMLRDTGQVTDPIVPTAKRSKYGNVPTQEDGYRFDSQLEAKRYRSLKALQNRGEITDLQPHPVYAFVINRVFIGRYTADFYYVKDGVAVVEDVKSRPTKSEAYTLRKNLMAAVHNIVVIEVMKEDVA